MKDECARNIRDSKGKLLLAVNLSCLVSLFLALHSEFSRIRTRQRKFFARGDGLIRLIAQRLTKNSDTPSVF